MIKNKNLKKKPKKPKKPRWVGAIENMMIEIGDKN